MGATHYTVGAVGVIQVGANEVLQLTDWTLNLTAAEIDLTVLGDSWSGFTTGTKNWTITANCILYMGDTNGQYNLINELLTGDGVVDSEVLIYAEDGSSNDGYFKGSAAVTNFSPNNPGNNDVLRGSITLRGKETLSWYAST